MKKTKMKLELDALSENEAFARTVIALFAARADPAVEELAELRTAVSEAVTNCVVHAYREEGDGQKRGRPGRIVLSASLSPAGITVKIKDHGCGIPDIARARTPLFTTDPGGERGGMGFAVMESFCDSCRVVSRVGHGTTVTLSKAFTHPAGGSHAG